jgi:hypothetical protein
MGRWIDKLQNIASVDSGSLEDVVPKALLLPVIAAFTSMADAIGAFFGVPISIFESIGESLDILIDGLFSQPGRILAAGGAETASSLQQGVWAQFGPLTYPIAVGVIVLSAYIVASYTAEEETGNLIPGLPMDVPLIGNNEDD